MRSAKKGKYQTVQLLVRIIALFRPVLGLTLISVLLSLHCQAYDNPGDELFDLELRETNAADALNEFAKQTGLVILYPYTEVKKKKANPVVGRYSVSNALEQLLKGSGLTSGFTEKGAVKISLYSTVANNKRGNDTMKKTSKSLGAKLAAAFVAAFGLSDGAVAQQAVESGGSVSKLMEEVVVTVRRKSAAENLQDVPVAVTAISAQAMDAAFVENLAEIGRMAPNVTLDPVSSVPGAASFFVRGMGVNNSSPSDDPAVSTIVDGMYMGLGWGTYVDLFELESVQVLRGPQGTLFGKNVTGGAVLMRTKRPTGEFGATIKGTLGSDERRDLAFSVENALIDDVLAGKLAVMTKSHGGYFDNIAIPGNEYGEEDLDIVRPTLRYTPNDKMTFDFIMEYGKQEGDGPGTKNIFNPLGIGIVPANKNDFDIAIGFLGNNEVEWKHFITEFVWELGNGTLTTTAAFRDLEVFTSSDLDGSSGLIFHLVDTTLDQDQQSLEVVYSGELTSRADITAGVFYFTQDYDYQEGRDLLNNLIRQRGKAKVDHEIKAAFVQSDINLSDDWTLTLGGRYTIEDKDATIARLGGCSLDFSTCTFFPKDSDTWNSFTPKVGLQWQPNEDIQFYGTYTVGFRSGGFNIRHSTTFTPMAYDQEEVKAYELGMKWSLPDGRGRLNLAAFYNEFSDLQRSVLDQNTSQSVLNAADAIIQGYEAELLLLLTDRLVLNASIGYTDAGYDSFDNLDLTGDNIPDPELAKDLDLVRVPEWTRALSATYDVPLDDMGNLTFRASYSFTDERSGNDTNTDIIDAYELYDASIGWSSPSDKLKVSLFGKNLTNEVYSHVSVAVSLFTTRYLAPPRTWGVEFSYDF